MMNEERSEMQVAAALASWGARLRRPAVRPPRSIMLLSFTGHIIAGVLVFLGGLQLRPELPEFATFRVSLMSPPPTEAAPVPELVDATTTPLVAEPDIATAPVRPRPDPPRTQAPVPQPVERPTQPEAAKGPDPKPATVGGENLEVVQEGAEFLFPEYQENIFRQLNRYFRWTGNPNLEVQIMFTILRDGSVQIASITPVKRSGDTLFDLEGINAVEMAGRSRAFGPLPDGWAADRLPVLAVFRPDR